MVVVVIDFPLDRSKSAIDIGASRQFAFKNAAKAFGQAFENGRGFDHRRGSGWVRSAAAEPIAGLGRKLQNDNARDGRDEREDDAKAEDQAERRTIWIVRSRCPKRDESADDGQLKREPAELCHAARVARRASRNEMAA